MQQTFWLHLAGACVVAIVATVPLLMSNMMDRGFEIAKQSVAEPLAVLALGSVLLAGGWNWLTRLDVGTKLAAGSLAVFLLLAVIASALAENPEVAIFGGYYRREGLLAWGVYGAFFFAVLGWAQRTDRIAGLLDVLLLVSVIPVIYALQQRMDLDIYPIGVRDVTRPGATLGNPVFLGAYLGILLPIIAARCWQARGALPEFALWLIVAALQVCGLLVTQSRGPLLAAALGMLMLACCLAGRARAQRFFVFVAVVVAFIAASLIAINALPGARQWAQEAPVVSRLIINPGRDTGIATQLASRSAGARLAIWEAGVETFIAAPPGDKLLGYGPESAYVHYFSHMTAPLMRAVGHGQYNTYDRMHADMLDIGLNFGALALLAYSLFFGSVMYAAARALWGLTGRAPAWLFVAFACAGGVFASAAAVQTGLVSAAVPAFGLGICAGWLLFMVGCAWRALKRGVPATPALQAGRWALLAGLTSALWVFCIDAQVNIPVLTTRLISFAIAALILIIAGGIMQSDGKDAECKPRAENNLRVWGVACALVAAAASWMPITAFDAGTGVQEAYWLRRALPILIFLFIAAFAGWVQARRNGGLSRSVVRNGLAVAAGLPLIYAAAHYALMVGPDSAASLNRARAIAIASYAGPVFILATCIAAAIVASRRAAPKTGAPQMSRAARWSIGAVVAPVLFVAALDWRATRADVASMLAPEAAGKQPHVGEQLIEEAIRLQPYERFYRRQLVFDLLGRALADIRKLDVAPERIPGVVRNLRAAEAQARAAASRFPHDPWVVVALANVLQVEALSVLRPLDPEGGLQAAREANQLFARTHRMLPSEPLLLRNWAQLVSDQGNTAEAYRLLDVMEKLLPNDPEPYAERIAIARQGSDYATINETLARARRALEPRVFSQVLSVAGVQQN